MMAETSLHCRLMTYNLGGGRKDFASNLAGILQVIANAAPDILVVQEAVDYQDADGTWFNVAEQIARIGGFRNNYFFGPTLSMKEHMHVERAIMVTGLFNDWQDWRHGNAMFCRWGFTRLSNSSRAGTPRNIPIYRPPVYEGNRDTDPRFVLLARLNQPPWYPFVMGVHLTTLLGERGPRELPGRAEQAQMVRFQQAKRLLRLGREHLLDHKELIFLLGDFNAASTEACITTALEGEGGFTRLIPTSGPLATHPKVADSVDHIFVYPAERLVGYQCWTVDNEIARSASDHLPVIADIVVK